jgi:hypothetical protein
VVTQNAGHGKRRSTAPGEDLSPPQTQPDTSPDRGVELPPQIGVPVDRAVMEETAVQLDGHVVVLVADVA